MRRGIKQMFNGENADGTEMMNGNGNGGPAQPKRAMLGQQAQHQQQQQQQHEMSPLQKPAGFLHKFLRSGGVTMDLNNQPQQQQQPPPSRQQQPFSTTTTTTNAHPYQQQHQPQHQPPPQQPSPAVALAPARARQQQQQQQQQQQTNQYQHLQQPQQQQPHQIVISQSPRTAASDLDSSIEADYAQIAQQPLKQRRDTSAPMSPKSVTFNDQQQQRQREQSLFAYPTQQQQQPTTNYGMPAVAAAYLPHQQQRSGSEQARPTTTLSHQQVGGHQQQMTQSLYAHLGAGGRGDGNGEVVGAFKAYTPPTQQQQQQHQSLQQQYAAAASRAGYDALGDRFTNNNATTTTNGASPLHGTTTTRTIPMAGVPSSSFAQHQRQPSAEETAGAALDEATRDLLRLSAEPMAKFRIPTGVQKAASASSVQRTVQPPPPLAGRFRLPQLFQSVDTDREFSPDTMSVTAAAARAGRCPTAPFAGFTRPAPGQQLPRPIADMEQQQRGDGQQQQGQPPMQPGHELMDGEGDDEGGPSHMLIHRHVQREHVLETDQKKLGPPVVKTTVEGKLKIEKTVGSHLMRCDHQIAKAYTVRDSTTHYRIRTTIGKRQLLIEEQRPASEAATSADEAGRTPTVRSSGTYRLSVYEDGKEVGTHEADIQLPENINKPEYLARLSERLLADLAALDDSQEQITAVTRVEIERIEDVTDIVKTYLIGLAAPKEEEQPVPLPTRLALPAEEFGYESASDHISEGPIELESRVYIDQLELEELPPRDIHLLQEGRLFEDRTRIGIQPKAAYEMSDDQESVESAPKPAPEVLAQVDCDLQRREDRSLMEVYIAVPLLQQITVILRLHRTKRKRPAREFAAGYGYEREGQQFHDVTRMTKTSRYESEESIERMEAPLPIFQVIAPRITVEESIAELPPMPRPPQERVMELQVREAMGAAYEYELAGQLHEGRGKLRVAGRKYSDESTVSSMGVVEPQPAIYAMEMGGQLLEGKQKLRRERRYESETSIDYEERAGGGITHVTMVKKEAKGHFEVTIECANSWGQMPPIHAKERPQQRHENMEFMKTMEKERVEQIRCEFTLQCANFWSAYHRTIAQQFVEAWLNITMERAGHLRERDSEGMVGRQLAAKRSEGMRFNLRESSSEQAMLMCSLERDNRGKDRASAETIRRAIQQAKIAPFYAAEFSSENVQLNLSIGASGRLPALQTESKARDVRIEKLGLRCAEFFQESASTMLYLKNSALAEASPVWLTLVEFRESKGHQLRTIAQQMSQLTQHVHLERKEYDNAQFSTDMRPLRVPRRDTVRKQLREFSVEDEHCAVLMENRGVTGERAAMEWGQQVTGGLLRQHRFCVSVRLCAISTACRFATAQFLPL